MAYYAHSDFASNPTIFPSLGRALVHVSILLLALASALSLIPALGNPNLTLSFPGHHSDVVLSLLTTLLVQLLYSLRAFWSLRSLSGQCRRRLSSIRYLSGREMNNNAQPTLANENFVVMIYAILS